MRTKIPLVFGEGLDRETGSMAVQPNTFQDLRNVFLHEGKIVLRSGFTAQAAQFPEVDQLVAGIALKSEQLGLVVGYNSSTLRVYVYRVTADGTEAELLDEWENDRGWTDTPVVHMAEVFGRIFMAHDERRVNRRAPTVYYDPVDGGGQVLQLTADWSAGPASPGGESVSESVAAGVIRFRGVVRHLAYLVGWGWGTAVENRPELVRISLPGTPTEFDRNHYFPAGDRRDPVVACAPAGSELMVWKRTETHAIFGYDRSTFGIRIADPRFGLIGSRLQVNVSGVAIAWSEEGPRVWGGAGLSEALDLPLNLQGWEPSDLVEEGDAAAAFAFYIPVERVCWFVFGRRVYALTVRVPGRWRWSYQELGFDAFSGFTLFGGEASTEAPAAIPIFDENETEPAGTYADIGVRPDDLAKLQGDETLEAWVRLRGLSEYGEAVIADEPEVYLRMDSIGPQELDYSGNLRHGDAEGDFTSAVDGLLGGSIRAKQFDGGIVTVPDDPEDVWADGVGILFSFWLEVLEIKDCTVLGIPDLMWVEMSADGTIAMVMRRSPSFGSSRAQRNFIAPDTSANLILEVGKVYHLSCWSNGNAGNTTPRRWTMVNAVDSGSVSGPGGSRTVDYEGTGFILGGGAAFSPDEPGVFVGVLDEVAVWTGIGDPEARELIQAQYALRDGEEVSTEWFLGRAVPVQLSALQVVRVPAPSIPPLLSGQPYQAALRYRRGTLFSPGASNAVPPELWPSISVGEFDTTVDPPEVLSGVWSRTADDAERITLTIRPVEGLEDVDIEVFRRLGTTGEFTSLDVISAPHAGDVEFVDETISGETNYQYAVRTNTAVVGALGAPTTVWSGPAAVPTYQYQAVVGGGYLIGFTPGDVTLATELHDAYDDNGGVEAKSLRATAAAGATEVSSGTLVNVPPGGLTFFGDLRHKQTSFGVDDFGRFAGEFDVTVPESE